MDFAKLLDDIIAVSDSIRFAFVTNEEGKVVCSKIATNSFLLDENRLSVLGVDMQILRRLLKLYDELIGKNTSVHLVRDKVHILIYYLNDLIILVSCDRSIDRHKLADISIQIESIINKSLK